MDSDCLIKLTRSGLTDAALALFATTCPRAVQDEVVRDGAGRAESRIVEGSIRSGKLTVFEGEVTDGDGALVEAFNTGIFDLIATDDRRLIRRLDPLGIPCVVPGLLLHELAARGSLSRAEALESLERLRPLVGADEYQITRFLLAGAGEEPSHGSEEHSAD